MSYFESNTSAGGSQAQESKNPAVLSESWELLNNQHKLYLGMFEENSGKLTSIFSAITGQAALSLPQWLRSHTALRETLNHLDQLYYAATDPGSPFLAQGYAPKGDLTRSTKRSLQSEEYQMHLVDRTRFNNAVATFKVMMAQLSSTSLGEGNNLTVSLYISRALEAGKQVLNISKTREEMLTHFHLWMEQEETKDPELDIQPQIVVNTNRPKASMAERANTKASQERGEEGSEDSISASLSAVDDEMSEAGEEDDAITVSNCDSGSEYVDEPSP